MCGYGYGYGYKYVDERKDIKFRNLMCARIVEQSVSVTIDESCKTLLVNSQSVKETHMCYVKLCMKKIIKNINSFLSNDNT